MKKGDHILGYRLVTNGSVSSGRCLWAFAEKTGKLYFVKQFVTPKFPIEGAPGSPGRKKEALKRCETFEVAQRRIMNAIKHKVATGGSIVAPVDFGRVGTTYYKIYDRIDVTNLSAAMIADMRADQKLLIMRVVAHSVSILHKENIVHGDMKPANILIKVTETGAFTAKLIDFDDSYFDGEPPEDAELVIGDPAYYSPELLDYVLNGSSEKRARITTKSDIFAMGVIFTEYWSGHLPKYDPSKFNSCAAAVLSGQKLLFSELSIPANITSLIESMVQRNPDSRPTAAEVLVGLKATAVSRAEAKPSPVAEEPTSRLMGGKRPVASTPSSMLGRSSYAAEGSPPVPGKAASRLLGKPKT
jgi:serine/threonine protein kinase